MEEKKQKFCEVCGKPLLSGKALTCAGECNRIRARKKRTEYNRLAKQRKQKCSICGGTVYPEAEGTEWFRLHYNCIIEDCADTLKGGHPLNTLQYQRMRRRGISIADVQEFLRQEAAEEKRRKEKKK